MIHRIFIIIIIIIWMRGGSPLVYLPQSYGQFPLTLFVLQKSDS